MLAAGYAVMWAGGVFSYLVLGGPPADAAWAPFVFLVLAAALVLAATPPGEWPALLICGALGLAAEAAGVRFGFPFGAYRYTAVLGARVLGVPVVMSCAWIILFSYVRQLASAARLPRGLRVVLASAWMVAIDLVIDPLAAGPLGYWTWTSRGAYYGVPLTNFAGWFIVSLVLFAAFPAAPAARPGTRFTGLSVVLFFTVIAFGAGLVVPGCIGLLLCATDLALARNRR